MGWVNGGLLLLLRVIRHGSVNGEFGKKENRNFALEALYFKWNGQKIREKSEAVHKR